MGVNSIVLVRNSKRIAGHHIFLKKDLGIEKEKIKILNQNQDFFTIEFPDIAWELFLTVVK